MSPDAEDASPSPEPGTEQESSIMAEIKGERASTEEKSPKSQTGQSQPSKGNAKDPSRPRRKKARRACFACQRAHLTCGDERPCTRCIKRGLQDQCHDGVRKKAKYLHDAPPEALMPGYAQNYAMNGNQNQNLSNVPASASVSQNGLAVSQAGAYYPQSTTGSFSPYSTATQPGHMGPPILDNNGIVSDFTSTQNVDTPTQYQSTSSQQVSPAQEMTNAFDQPTAIGTTGSQSFDHPPYFDPNDTSLFNFNISDLNFGNHYGALEFGMLGQMSSGAVNTPDLDHMNAMNNQNGISYDGTGSFAPGFGYNQTYPSWQTVPNAASRQNSSTVWSTQGNGLEAFAIGEQASSLTGASPRSQNQDFPGQQSANTSPDVQFAQLEQQNQQPDLLRQSLSQAQRKQPPFPGDPHWDTKKGRRNASEIYASVQAPYSYTQGFHALTALLQKRFPKDKVLRVAKALSTIRPSFISCNQNLNMDDLIHMEKCFQRTLYEYEGFIGHYGTPTIVCRRTGEIAAVSKEFCLVTGWRRDVLLGKEPNLNVNFGGSSSSGTHTGASSRGAATPRIASLEVDPGRPQSVFLAEIMDEDSVAQFYEDFAELAFGASRTSMIGAPCDLLKYRTKDDPGWAANDHFDEDGKRNKKSGEVKSEPLIQGEAGMNALGQRDGRVKCQMSWSIKRDTFDIPMIIVMNFLPMI